MNVREIFGRVLPVLLGCLVSAGCSREEQAAAVPPLSEQVAQGAELYGQSCTVCHYDGAGNPVAADLKGSAIVAGDPSKVISIILFGQSNVSMVNGRKFNGNMPKMDYFTDAEVAAITAYVRATFADKQEAIDPALVKSLRK